MLTRGDELASAYIGRDYAGVITEDFVFYYGYEVQDENKKWCFKVAAKSGAAITIPFQDLAAENMFDCPLCLLAGIGFLIEKRLLDDLANRTANATDACSDRR